MMAKKGRVVNDHVNIFGYMPGGYRELLQWPMLKQFFKDMNLDINIPGMHGDRAYKKAESALFSLCLSEISVPVAEHYLKINGVPMRLTYPVGIQSVLNLMGQMEREVPVLRRQACFQKVFDGYKRQITYPKNQYKLFQKGVLLQNTVIGHEISSCLETDFALKMTQSKEVLEAGTEKDVLLVGELSHDHSISKGTLIELECGGYREDEYLYDNSGWLGMMGYSKLQEIIKGTQGL